MGGTNSKENLILLTAREHFLSHWLLWRIYRTRSMACAFSNMSRPSKKRIFTASGKSFEESRQAYSEFMRGSGNPNYGKLWTDKKKIDFSGAGNPMYKKKRPDVTQRLLNNHPFKNLETRKRSGIKIKDYWTKHTKIGLSGSSNPNYGNPSGFKPTDEQRKKRSEMTKEWWRLRKEKINNEK